MAADPLPIPLLTLLILHILGLDVLEFYGKVTRQTNAR
jgi:hypothetical protein